MTGDVTFTLPVDGGTNGQVMLTDGSGNLSWGNLDQSNIDVTGTNGGLLYNNGGDMTTTGNISISDGTGTLTLGDGDTAGSLTINDGNGEGVSFDTDPAMTSSYTLTWPLDDGDPNEFLMTDGSGNLTWEPINLTAGNVALEGDNGGLLYNLNDTIATTSNISLDDGTGALTANSLTAGSDGTDGIINIYSEQGGTDYTASIQTNSAMTGDVTFTLPVDGGTNGQTLITDGSGNFSWQTIVSGNKGDGAANQLTYWAASDSLNGASGIYINNSSTFMGVNTAIPNYTLDVTGTVNIGNNGTDGNLRIFSEQGGTDYSILFQPNAAMTQNVTYTLPPNDGDSGQFLSTDGSGALTWDSVEETDISVTGTDGGLMYNDGGDMTTATNITLDDTSGDITLNLLTADSLSANTVVGTDIYGDNITAQNGAIDTLNLGDGSTKGQMVMNDGDGESVSFNTGDILSSYTLTWPLDDGDPNEFLMTNGSGVMSWEPISVTGGNVALVGNTGGLLYNDADTVATTGNIGINDTNGSITLGDSDTAGGITISDGNGQSVSFDTDPAMTTNYTLTWPLDDGDANEFLMSDGNGNMSWESIADSAITITGTDTGAIYNNNGDIGVADNILMNDASGSIQLGANGQDGGITIYSEQGGTDYQVTFAPNATMTQNTTYTLPADDGDADEVLTTDGSGNLTWEAGASGGSTVYDISTESAYGSNQNNLVLTANNTVYRLSASSNMAITGFDNTVFEDGAIITIINVGSNRIRLRNENSSSTAANRIITPGGGNLNLQSNGVATLMYDGTSQRWRVISTN